MNISQDTKLIPLTQGKFAIVDAADFDWLMQFKWTYNPTNSGYARRVCYKGEKPVDIRMHRLITDCPKESHVDHINGNGLDNRRENLRVCTNRQNSFSQRIAKNNTSGYKGVYHDSRYDSWSACIYKSGKIYIGTFKNPIDAAKAYDKAAIEYFGEFALTNKQLGVIT